MSIKSLFLLILYREVIERFFNTNSLELLVFHRFTSPHQQLSTGSTTRRKLRYAAATTTTVATLVRCLITDDHTRPIGSDDACGRRPRTHTPRARGARRPAAARERLWRRRTVPYVQSVVVSLSSSSDRRLRASA